MKLQKIILLIFLLSVALALTGCGQSSEFSSYLEIEKNINDFKEVYQIDGSVVGYNYDYDVIAVESDEVYSNGDVEKTVRVYDLTSGKTLYTDTVFAMQSDGVTSTITADLSNYPLVRIAKNHPVFDSELNYYVDDYSYTYTFVKDEYPNTLLMDTKDPNYRFAKIGDVYIVALPDYLYWVNGDLETMRKDPSDVADSYINGYDIEDYFGIDAEYNGYLYDWTFDELTRSISVFDNNGLCVMQYNHPNDVVAYEDTDSLINPEIFILDNGNIFVQECRVAKEDEDYDFYYNGTKFVMTSKIIDYTSGEVTELDLDVVVLDLESAHEQKTDDDRDILPFNLKEKNTNIISYTTIVNKQISALTYISVVDNSLGSLYDFVNSEIALKGQNCIIEFATDEYYCLVTEWGLDFKVYVYNYDGELITSFFSNIIGNTEKYIVYSSGIYNYEGELVYSFEDSILTGVIPENNDYILTNISDIYVAIPDYENGVSSIYRFDDKESEFVLVTDGVDLDFDDHGDGYVVVYDTENDSYTFINSEGTPLLKTQKDMDITETDNTVFVEATVDGEPVVYVICDGSRRAE